MLYPSRYNHLNSVRTVDGDQVHVIGNLFLGASDIVSAPVYDAFADAEHKGCIEQSAFASNVADYFVQRGLLWTDADAEEKLIQEVGYTYGDRDQLAAGLKGGQYGFIMSLYCNLDCPYCFQKERADSCGFLSEKQIDLGISAIKQCEERAAQLAGTAATVPKISITGGEPLLRNKRNIAALDYLVSRLIERDWPFNITTNGTELEWYVENHAATEKCRNIQVTRDGPREVHDRRRHFRGGAPSFDRIAAGVNGALASGWKITLRVNLDMENVSTLPALGTFIQQRGWLGYDRFSAYVSPVTDHSSVALRDESELLEALLAVVKDAPAVRDVFDIRHFRGFNYVERMLVHHQPRFPVIFRCEAATGMYIFDPKGDIHVCLEAVGDAELRVGRYDPEWELDDKAFARWAGRNVLALDHCRNCKIKFICAGGCTLESFNKGDRNCCMPFLKEMDVAWQYFADTRPDLFGLASVDEAC